MKKIRIDELLVEKGLAKDINEAARIIMAGLAIADDRRIDKAGDKVPLWAEVRLKGQRKEFVSRGGYKLQGAVSAFCLNMENALVLDIGASTGGFTDVCLQEGAARVFALDVGKGLIHNSLRTHPKVRLIEGINFREASFETIGCQVDFIVTDVSFISLKRIIPETIKFCRQATEFICLIKPQFEACRDEVGQGGIVQDKNIHSRVCHEIIDCANDYGFRAKGLIKSPITGTKGNVEYLAYLVYSGSSKDETDDFDIGRAICEECGLNS